MKKKSKKKVWTKSSFAIRDAAYEMLKDEQDVNKDANGAIYSNRCKLVTLSVIYIFDVWYMSKWCGGIQILDFVQIKCSDRRLGYIPMSAEKRKAPEHWNIWLVFIQMIFIFLIR